MPFTFAHPAIVFPLKRLGKYRLDLTALVIGSMVPDFEYFLRLRVKSIYSHTLSGLFWFDLPLATVLYLIYQLWAKVPLIDNLPKFLNIRFAEYRSKPAINARLFLIIIIPIIIGAATHLFWDSFTHPAGYFVTRWTVLHRQLTIMGHYVAIYKILQHSSTVIGLTIIAIVIAQLKPHPQMRQYNRWYFWMVVFGVMLILLTVRFLTGLELKDYGDTIINIISGLLLGITIAGVLIRCAAKPSF